jgi:hypothetical protein
LVLVLVRLRPLLDYFILRGMDDIPLAVGGLHRDFPVPCLPREESIACGSQRGHELTHLDNVVSFETTEFSARFSTDNSKGEKVFVFGVTTERHHSDGWIFCCERMELVFAILSQLMGVLTGLDADPSFLPASEDLCPSPQVAATALDAAFLQLTRRALRLSHGLACRRSSSHLQSKNGCNGDSVNFRSTYTVSDDSGCWS